MTPKLQAVKAKKKKKGEIKKRKELLYSKRNNEQNEKATYRTGENICQPSI